MTSDADKMMMEAAQAIAASEMRPAQPQVQVVVQPQPQPVQVQPQPQVQPQTQVYVQPTPAPQPQYAQPVYQQPQQQYSTNGAPPTQVVYQQPQPQQFQQQPTMIDRRATVGISLDGLGAGPGPSVNQGYGGFAPPSNQDDFLGGMGARNAPPPRAQPSPIAFTPYQPQEPQRTPQGFSQPNGEIQRRDTDFMSAGLGNMTGIEPNESAQFMNASEQNSLFGAGAMKPDTMKIPLAPTGGSYQMMANDNMDDYQQLQGEFKIERGFAGMERSFQFSVCNPQKPKGGDYIQYTVFGTDKGGKFEIVRRYSDFLVLRTTFLDRFPGLYIPPLPKKKTMGNQKVSFVEERCFLLNMFIRQLSRCPYLIESSEFSIFVRPSNPNLQRELSLLPRMSPENNLNRIQDYYSFIGNISDSQILGQNAQIMAFSTQAKKMHLFLKKFKGHIDDMEGDFEQAVVEQNQMNSLLKTYEGNLVASYGDGGRSIEDSCLVFWSDKSTELNEEIEQQPKKMQNPFTVMRRWLKFEILDLEAILEAIETKNEMEKRRISKQTQRNSNITELQKMKDGKSTLSTFFLGKDSKITKITKLTNEIQTSEKDIECLGLLHKIIVLQLNQAAIQFFKRDKFTTYNHTVNLYSAKNIENNTHKLSVFKKLREMNLQVIEQFEGITGFQIEMTPVEILEKKMEVVNDSGAFGSRGEKPETEVVQNTANAAAPLKHLPMDADSGASSENSADGAEILQELKGELGMDESIINNRDVSMALPASRGSELLSREASQSQVKPRVGSMEGKEGDQKSGFEGLQYDPRRDLPSMSVIEPKQDKL